MKKFASDSVGLTILNAIGWFAAFILFAAIAGFFGADWQTDAFFLAWTIPALFIGSVSSTITAVFIPVLTKQRANQPDTLGELAGSAIVYVSLFSLLASVGIGLIAPLAFRIANPRLSDQSLQLVYQILLLLLPMITFQMANGVLAAMYNVFGKFWLPAGSLIIRYLTSLALIVILRQNLGIISIPVSLLIGSAIATITLLFFWSRLNIKITLKWGINKEVNKAFRVALPLILGMFALQLGVVVTRFLAVRLPSGNVSVLDYANRVSIGVMEILTSGVFLVTLANWSNLVADGNEKELQKRLRYTIRIMLFVVLPVVVVLLILREPVISILFQRGEFDTRLTAETATVLVYFLVGIPITVISRTYVQLFLVWQQTWRLAVLATLRVISTILVSLILLDFMGVKAIAFADTVGTSLTCVGLILLSYNRIGNPLKGQGVLLLKLSIAVLGTGLITAAVNQLLIDNSVWIRVPGAAIVGAIFYILITWLLRIEEFFVAWRSISPISRRELN